MLNIKNWGDDLMLKKKLSKIICSSMALTFVASAPIITTANTYDIRVADISTGSSMAAGTKIPGVKGSEVVIKAKLYLQ